MKKSSLLLIFAFLFSWANFVSAQDNIEVDFFYRSTCPHCAAEKVFLSELEEKYPELKVNKYEISDSAENQRLLKDLYNRYRVPVREQGWVPVTFTPAKYFVGYNEQIGKQIESCLMQCAGEAGEAQETVKVPIIGEINPSRVSLPLLAIILGALDGFNPCAMWVLLFLIALLVNVRSRKKMWLVGGTFLAVSGIVYYLILSAWLNLFLAISYVNITRILIGLSAMAVGVWQIRNFFSFRPGVCKITDSKVGVMDKVKNHFKSQAEKIAFSPLTLGILAGAAVLAIAVNLVEFACSAGLPAIFTRILALNGLNFLSYNFYLLLYTLIFMLDDIIVLSLAVITLSRFGLSEKYNYWATLIGGLLILILGILLILKPQLLMFA